MAVRYQCSLCDLFFKTNFTLLYIKLCHHGDICCTSRGIAHFVLNFVAMATRVCRGKIQLAAFDGPLSKTPSQMQKKSRRYLLHKSSYNQFCPEFRCHGNGGQSGENAIGSIQWLITIIPLSCFIDTSSYATVLRVQLAIPAYSSVVKM